MKDPRAGSATRPNPESTTMKILGVIIAAGLILCVLRVAIVGLMLLMAAMLLWGVFCKPVETFGLLLFCLMASLVERHPLPCLALLAIATLANCRAANRDPQGSSRPSN